MCAPEFLFVAKSHIIHRTTFTSEGADVLINISNDGYLGQQQ